MKVSLICTVKNEDETIKGLLDSISEQTKKPDEIIFVDGGSTDKTVEILNAYRRILKNLKVIVKAGVNIAAGRNIAIQNASHEIIASADGGCVLDKNWLKFITAPFPKYDVVSGAYRPLAKNDFEFFQGAIVCPDPKKIITPSRMSSRSIAFKKSCWAKVGGYPEKTLTGEDTLFNISLQQAGFIFTNATEALVYWRMRPTWRKFARQFYIYGVGDKKSSNLFKLKRNLLMLVLFYISIMLFVFGLVFNWEISLLIVLLYLFYFGIAGISLLFKTKRLKALAYGPALFGIKRLAYIIGVSGRK